MITVNQLTYTYPHAAQPTLHALSFNLAAGEVFGFLGPSGAGKSTTQKILTGLLKGFQGQVEVLGRPLSAWGSDLYERIGVSFELPNHFLKLSGAENLAYFAALYQRPTLPVRQLLAQVGLEADADQPVGEYSKGMKIRLNVARALLHQPDVLFLDEPTSGLDPATAHQIKELVRAQQAQGRTIFLTTHNMALAEDLCDRVAFIIDGRITLVDAPQALKLQYGQALVRVGYRQAAGMANADFPLDGLADQPGFLGLLRAGQVQTIHSQEATLEEIFLRVTGRSLQ